MSLELRMYGLVPYNISPIQQAIQYSHSVNEYTISMLDAYNGSDSKSMYHNITLYNEYIDWLYNYKTYIILNGGTTNNNPTNLGTLNKHADYLESIGVFISRFSEPDLGDQLTSFCFIINEKVFNKKLYPDYQCDFKKFILDDKVDNKIWSEELNEFVIEEDYKNWRLGFNEDEKTVTKIIKIRQFLKPLKLA